MKKIKIYIGLLFFLLGNQLDGQGLATSDFDFYIEASFLGTELQLKPHFFMPMKNENQIQSGIGAELLGGIIFKKKWIGQVGLEYLRLAFTSGGVRDLVISNPTGGEEISNTFEYSIQNPLMGYEVSYTIDINQRGCFRFYNRFPRKITAGDSFEGRVSSWNTMHTLGIPLKIGRQFMNGKIKWYTNLSLAPKIIFRKNADTGQNKKIAFGVSGHQKGNCLTEFADPISTVETSGTLSQIHWNILDYRLDWSAEIGFINRIKSNQIKIGIFYGESITPFSKLNNDKFKIQFGGVKLGYSLNVKR